MKKKRTSYKKHAALAAKIANTIDNEADGNEYMVLTLIAHLIFGGRIKIEFTH